MVTNYSTKNDSFVPADVPRNNIMENLKSNVSKNRNINLLKDFLHLETCLLELKIEMMTPPNIHKDTL